MQSDSDLGSRFTRRRLLGLIPVLGASTLVPGCSDPAPGRQFGLSMVGVEISSVDATLSLAREVGRSADVLNFYDAFEWGSGFPTGLVTAIADAGCIPEITWEPWHPHGGVEQPDYALAQIAGGRYDAYVARWAQAAAEYGNRVMLRFAHEMNGDWYPWSVRRNGGDPAAYVAAFRRVRRTFDAAGASNVEWVWSPNVVIGGDESALTESYPGDDYVDLIGLDGYNFGDDETGRIWTDPAQLFGPSLGVLDQLAPRKTLWINEIGSTDLGGDKAGWIEDAVRYLESTRVRGLMWFEVASPGAQDWRLTATRATSSAAALALSRW